ncbi:MAG: T9SS type A sorting domain-containing protein [Syntrophothermus sp.]
MKRLVLLFVLLIYGVLPGQNGMVCPTMSDIDNIYFLNNYIGWISTKKHTPSIGIRAEVIKTIDGGQTWKYENIEGFQDIFFVDKEVGFMVSSFNILKTSNGGLNWNIIYSYNTEFTTIEFLNRNIGYVTGINFVSKTINGGDSWQIMLNGGIFNIADMWCFNENNLIIIGEERKIKKTTDGGLTWYEPVSALECFNLTDIYFVDSLTGYITGHRGDFEKKGGIQKTTDGGNTWSVKTNLLNLHQIYFIDSITGFAYGNIFFYRNDYYGSSFFLKTTDKGESWEFYYMNSDHTFYKMFYSNEYFYAGGSKGFIAKSSDYGKNWINLCQKDTVSSIKDGSLFIENENYSLNQNYPNPFNPTTTIKFSLPKEEFVEIIIYDVLGNEVARVVKENFSPGSYEREWDASKISSGIYYLSMKAGEFSQTRKMILMK